MAHGTNPLDHAEVQQASFTGYIAGYAVTVLVLLASLLLTRFHAFPAIPLLATISSLAIIVLIVQAFLFFGLSLTEANIWKSISVILTVPLFILSIGLSVWMFHALDGVMMMSTPEMPGMSMQPTILQ